MTEAILNYMIDKTYAALRSMCFDSSDAELAANTTITTTRNSQAAELTSVILI